MYRIIKPEKLSGYNFDQNEFGITALKIRKFGENTHCNPVFQFSSDLALGIGLVATFFLFV